MVEKISESLLNIIKEGETYTTELKEATTNLPKSLFESLWVHSPTLASNLLA